MKAPRRLPPGLELDLYRDLARTFRSFELQTVAEEILNSLLHHMAADYGILMLLGEKGHYVERIFRAGFPGTRTAADRFGLSRSEVEALVRDMIPKFKVYGPGSQDRPAAPDEGALVGAAAFFPLQLVYDYAGLLVLTVKEENLPTTLLHAEGFRLLERVLPDFSFALKNALTARRMNELITKDDLTLAFNRRFFEDYLAEEMERARRYNNPLSLIFLDLDGLREVNTRFGHAMGSRTLQEAAARIMNAVRSIDKVVRYGGDEFCIVLPETAWEGALEVAERIRQRLASTPFLLEETGGIEITGSFGLASYPAHALTKEDLIKRADEAMYRIKSQTKNDIQVARPLKRFP